MVNRLVSWECFVDIQYLTGIEFKMSLGELIYIVTTSWIDGNRHDDMVQALVPLTLFLSKIYNVLVWNIFNRSQRHFAHATTVALWSVEHILEPQHSKFLLNFEFDRSPVSGTSARTAEQHLRDYTIHRIDILHSIILIWNVKTMYVWMQKVVIMHSRYLAAPFLK